MILALSPLRVPWRVIERNLLELPALWGPSLGLGRFSALCGWWGLLLDGLRIILAIASGGLLQGILPLDRGAQPSCSQKRTLLFAEHLTQEVLPDLPHRQFVFAIPKALRLFFRHDRRLFSTVSRLIYRIIQNFYREAAGTASCAKTMKTKSGWILSYSRWDRTLASLDN